MIEFRILFYEIFFIQDVNNDIQGIVVINYI